MGYIQSVEGPKSKASCPQRRRNPARVSKIVEEEKTFSLYPAFFAEASF